MWANARYTWVTFKVQHFPSLQKYLYIFRQTKNVYWAKVITQLCFILTFLFSGACIKPIISPNRKLN